MTSRSYRRQIIYCADESTFGSRFISLVLEYLLSLGGLAVRVCVLVGGWHDTCALSQLLQPRRFKHSRVSSMVDVLHHVSMFMSSCLYVEDMARSELEEVFQSEGAAREPSTFGYGNRALVRLSNEMVGDVWQRLRKKLPRAGSKHPHGPQSAGHRGGIQKQVYRDGASQGRVQHIVADYYPS